jgi:ferredoxin-type protein NapH
VLALCLATVLVLPLASLARAVERGAGAPQVGAPGPGPRIAAAAPWLAPVGSVLSGSVWSITIAGFEVADPLAAALVVAAGRSAVLLAAAAVPVLATLLGGRLFCGWVCPARLPVELAAWIRRKGRRPVVRAPWLRWVKYGVLAGGLGLAALTGWNLVALIYPPAILVREAHYCLVYGAAGWGAVVVAAAFVADLVVERGAWCRGLCPGGALYSLLGQPAVLKLRVREDRCTRCERCLKVCPLGLDPTAAPGGECDRCGLCQRACREDALQYRVAPPFARDAGVGVAPEKIV